VLVREPGELGDRQHLARDVRGARDREQGGGSRGELVGERRERLGDRRLRDDDSASAPGQQVRVVFDVEHDGLAGHGACEEVQRIGRVAREDDEVVVAGADVAGDGLPGILDEGGRRLRRVAAAAVHARVVRQHPRHVPGDGVERGGGCGDVEVHVAHRGGL
jgi:hypothetical protein